MATFVRFGGLSLRKQNGYSVNPTSFHQPPCRRGIYAFPLKAIELFLIGGGYGGISFEKKKEQRRQFEHDGMVWHHLKDHCKPSMIVAEHGSWVKTTVKDWQRAVMKESMKCRYWTYDDDKKIKSLNNPVRSGISGMYAKDHFEVFIDQKVG